MDLTNSETIHEALGRTAIITPRARLQKLTVRIRKIKEKYEEGTPEANLTLLVLERLEKARGELDEDIERLEAVCGQRGKPHFLASETDHEATPPRANSVINETSERIEAPFTEQPGVSKPGITEERVKFLLQEFEDSTVHPLEERMKRTVSLELRNQLHRTEALEEDTSGLKDDFDRLKRETEQRLREVTEDLVGTTLDRVSELEKKNAGLEDRNDKLEADLKALTAQVDELLKAKLNADQAVVEANARAAKEV
ncbi:titin homolog [Impatiens glandulifera]|uniref:titin homolog n=1 Tax=Impatiens glandulifera TaxID=253017 RepID=UPI001FB0C1AE|nr:titin homolog [Impatiens glandulifera]